MGERQRRFRTGYRERIARWYNGWLHVAIIYLIGIVAFYVYISHIHQVLPLEWSVIPIVFLACNLFEWSLHAQVMHRPRDVLGLRAVYQRHTLAHHQFFTREEMRFASQRDWRVTLFPPYALIVLITLSVPAACILGVTISANVGWLTMCVTTGMYLVYEFMHFCCHVEENAFVRLAPFVNTIRRHHTAHHDQSIMMERNMNLTFPIADWLFGTSDLERGLLGHLFNGYDEKHVRRDMRKTSANPARSVA
jgi:hypothetical protein